MTICPQKQLSCGRELRVDFLRGVALLVVLIDHIEFLGGVQLVSLLTPISTGLSDGAEAFVFLSGTVFGIAYSERIQQRGFLSVQKSMVRRSLVIYLTFLLATWSAICLAVLLGNFSSTLARQVNLSAGLATTGLWSLSMCYQLYGLHILPFYVFLMPFAACLLWLHLRFRYLAWILSMGIYLAARHLPGLGLPQYPWGHEWYFNPFSWQFVFFLGLVCSQSKWQILSRPAVRTSVTILAVAVLLISFRFRLYKNGWPPEFQELDSSILGWLAGWKEKSRPHPVRIFHFLSLACLIACALPAKASKFWQSAFAAPIIKTGQHSLQVYAFGVVAMYFSIPVLDAYHGVPGPVSMVTFYCCLLSIGFAYLVARWKSSQKSSRKVAQVRLAVETDQS